MDRQAIVEAVQSYVGCGAMTEPDRYWRIIGGSREAESRQAEMTRMSGCALFIRELWWRWGLRHTRLAVPYRNHPGAVNDLVVTAHALATDKEKVFRRIPCRDGEIQVVPGDVVVVGGKGKGGPEHVFTVTSADGMPTVKGSAPAIRIQSVDGGQKHREKGGQLIDGINRTWERLPGKVVDVVRYPGGLEMRRDVAYIINVDYLLLRTTAGASAVATEGA